jgi:hypothetical protein
MSAEPRWQTTVVAIVVLACVIVVLVLDAAERRRRADCARQGGVWSVREKVCLRAER